MKKFACLLMVLLALLPLSASAISQEEWDQKCRSKTSGSVTIYAIDVASDGTKTTREIDAIPAGQYVAIGGADYDLEMRLVAYFDGGVEKSGYAHKDAPIVSATQFVYFTNGTSLPLPEALANDLPALEAYIARLWPDLTIYGDGTKPVSVDGTQPLASEAPQKEAAESETAESEEPKMTASPTPAVSREADSAQTSEPKQTGSTAKASIGQTGVPALYQGENVTAVRIGLATSTIVAGEETLDVSTGDLTFGSNTDSDKRIGVIWAPNSGQCTLREGPSDDADSLGTCDAGMIVAVLEPGEEYTQIVYENVAGYVQTRCLQFHTGDASVLGTGMLTYNGRGNGSTTINIRSDADRGTAKIAEWRTGTLVTVLSHEDGWVEIECDGLRGYVMEEFLTMQE